MSSRLLRRLSRWLLQTMEADGRYICAACDDRFRGRGEGVAHVVHCHPESAGILADEAVATGRTQAAEPCPTRKDAASNRPFLPATSWS
ncbi:MAG: hypothetical protein ACOH1Y_00810 [Propionicimonas sp.]